jgi:two-component system response regulator DesR
VLTDIEMPRMDGIEAVQELRKTLPDCRVIFHTSRTEPEVMAAAFSAGAAGYLIKGSAQSLISAIRTVVRHAWDRAEELAIGRNAHPIL